MKRGGKQTDMVEGCVEGMVVRGDDLTFLCSEEIYQVHTHYSGVREEVCVGMGGGGRGELTYLPSGEI